MSKIDWKNFNFDWESAKYFYVIALEGSFTAAAKFLGVSQPTVSRQIASLEESLGVSLFERSVKGLTLTDTGYALFELVKQMATSAREFSQLAEWQSTETSGKVCISAPEIFAGLMLPSAIKEIRKRHPEIELEIIATNKVSDLIQREADIAIRVFRPSQPELITRKLRRFKGRFYASKDYIDTLTKPITPQSICNATFIDFDSRSAVVKTLNPEYSKLDINNLPFIVHSDFVKWEMIKSGLGIGLMVEEYGDLEPSVEQVLSGFPAFEFDLWLVAHRELRTTPRFKIVFDILIEILGS